MKSKKRCADVGYSLHKSFTGRVDLPRFCWLRDPLKDFTCKVVDFSRFFKKKRGVKGGILEWEESVEKAYEGGDERVIIIIFISH